MVPMINMSIVERIRYPMRSSGLVSGCAAIPAIEDAAMNPIRYPPVGPSNHDAPDASPAKNGSPSIPKSRYNVMLVAPYAEPSAKPDSSTKNVCNVKGTGVKGSGILTNAPAAVAKQKKRMPSTLRRTIMRISVFRATNS